MGQGALLYLMVLCLFKVEKFNTQASPLIVRKLGRMR